MKIVHVMSSYVPNLGYQENYLPAAQKKLGHEVEIITSDRAVFIPHYEESVGHVLGHRIIGTGVFFDNDIKIHRLKCRFELRSHGEILLKGLKQKLSELNPDIVQAHGSIGLPTVQSVLYQKPLGYNLFLDAHISYKNLQPYLLYKKAYLRFFKYVFYPIFLDRIKKIFPISKETEDVLIHELSIPKDKIDLIPLGVDSERFVFNKNQRKQMRNNLRIEKDDVVGIYAGKLSPIKQIPFLINTSEMLLKKYDNFKLIILGNGPRNYENEIKELAHNKGLTDKIIFHDFVKNADLPSFYSSADFGVWPWGSSNTMLEAMSCSLPLLIAKSEDTNHLIESNNGLSFEANDEKNFQKYIEKLIQDTKLRKDMGCNSRKFIEEKFSSDILAEQTIKAYIYAFRKKSERFR